MPHSSSTPLSRTRWLMPMVSILTAVTSICTSAATRLAAQSSAKRDTTSISVPGIPALPDVVTAIPFHAFHDTAHTYPWVLVQAEVDGHRGTFSLDTGSPVIFLNTVYLRPNTRGGLDTVRKVKQPPDTTQGNHQMGMPFLTVHTVRVGTLIQPISSTVAGPPPLAGYPTNALAQEFNDNGLLGNLGLTALEPFETIIDYVHHRVIFIRLDAAGHRLAAVPAYTPAGTVPLLPNPLRGAGIPPGTPPQHWGIQVRCGVVMDTLLVDTGAPTSDTTEEVQAADKLKQAIAANPNAGNTVTSIFSVPWEKGKKSNDSFGSLFLERLGVVGFNLRTHQLILYR